ncbi:MAG: hypothetical protein JNN08_12205 [Bryobacterales bacterium]|nr:hypothetical protein [Bryobacterales bacterium]
MDTQVFSLLSEASDDKWRQRFWRVLDQQYRYIISPLSMFELFFGLAASEGNHFATHQERFRQLCGPRTPGQLPSCQRRPAKGCAQCGDAGMRAALGGFTYPSQTTPAARA